MREVKKERERKRRKEKEKLYTRQKVARNKMENFESKIFRGQNSPTFGRKLKRTVRHDITEKLISMVISKARSSM